MREFLQAYSDVLNGQESSPRGQKIREQQNYMFTIHPRERFTSFNHRKFNLDYAKFEMLWYLGADPYDDSITKTASMWAGLQQTDGRWLSNYGQYWFGDQKGFNWVVNQLQMDKDSRQAVIPMLNHTHLFTGNKDIVCTECISFRIRDDRLHMSVNMRSQDIVWGLTNDIFCFSILYEMVYAYLQETAYYKLRMGSYTHKVDSLHVYERHFEMLEKIVEEGEIGFEPLFCPLINGRSEVQFLIQDVKNYGPDGVDAKLVPEGYDFTWWLYDNKYTREN